MDVFPVKTEGDDILIEVPDDELTTNGAATLEIIDLHAEVEGKEILKGIDLVVKQGRDPRPDGAERLRASRPCRT